MDNNEDLINSRDLQERIEELEATTDGAELVSDDPAEYKLPNGDVCTEEMAELASLRAFASEFEAYAPDYHYGETAIRDTYFQEYAEQLADDIGAIPKDAAWPNNCIDWDQAAELLKQDYTAIEFDNVRYWVR